MQDINIKCELAKKDIVSFLIKNQLWTRSGSPKDKKAAYLLAEFLGIDIKFNKESAKVFLVEKYESMPELKVKSDHKSKVLPKKEYKYKPLKWAATREQSQYIVGRKKENIERSYRNQNENWFHAELLLNTKYKFNRQAIWGYRIYDFWCACLGIAVEVDGPEHNEAYDSYRDNYNYRRSGIIVLHVRNKNDDDAEQAFEIINNAMTWKERRLMLDIDPDRKKASRETLSGERDHLFPPKIMHHS